VGLFVLPLGFSWKLKFVWLMVASRLLREAGQILVNVTVRQRY
jgi:hypothetical protein